MTVRETHPADELRLLPVATVAKYLAVSRSKVYGLMDAGELPYVKLGKCRRVTMESVTNLVRENVVQR